MQNDLMAALFATQLGFFSRNSVCEYNKSKSNMDKSDTYKEFSNISFLIQEFLQTKYFSLRSDQISDET